MRYLKASSSLLQTHQLRKPQSEIFKASVTILLQPSFRPFPLIYLTSYDLLSDSLKNLSMHFSVLGGTALQLVFSLPLLPSLMMTSLIKGLTSEFSAASFLRCFYFCLPELLTCGHLPCVLQLHDILWSSGGASLPLATASYSSTDMLLQAFV